MNTTDIYKDDNYGKIAGKYTILEKIRKTSKYVVKCNKCGYINSNGMRMDVAMKSDPNSVCNHRGVINPSIEDHIGEVHGKYRIIGCLNKRDSDHNMLYVVQCIDCGKIFNKGKTIPKLDLSIAGTECNHKMDPRDRIGEVHGKYRIIGYIGTNRYYHQMYVVQCLKCGYINYAGMSYSDIVKSNIDDSRCSHEPPTSIGDKAISKLQFKYTDKIVICAEIKE